MIVQFIKRDSSIYAIEGLAHMGSSDGGIVELKKNNGNWTITDYLRLPFAPYAAQLDVKNNLVIVTSDNLISIDRNRNVDTLIKQGFWADLYPTSIVIKDNIVYIGMRQGILKFNLLLKRPEWFMP